MPNPRTFALIGLASAVAAIAPHRAFKFEGTPRLDRPDVYGIAVRSDTIWFCATAARDSQRVSYGFARASRSWTTIAGDRPCATATRKVRTTYLDSLPVSLASGVRVEVVSPPRDSSGERHGRSTLRFIDSARSLSLDLKPVVAPERIQRLLARVGSVDEDTTAVTLGGIVANDSLAWIGLTGGFPEGEGAMGGIYRIDRRSGAWQYIVDSTLSWHAVTGLAQTRDWLWVGTEQPAEYGAFGRAGLRRMDLRSGDWREFTAANSALPDARIIHVAGDDNAVAVATEKGLAVIELRAAGAPREIDRWNAQYYVPAFIGDSLAMKIGAKAEAPTEDVEAQYIFAQEFAKRGHERPVFEQLKKIPLRMTRGALDGSLDLTDRQMLANPAYAPILVSMFASHPAARRAAAGAVKRLGVKTPAAVREAAHEAFAAVDSSQSRDDLLTIEVLAGALRAFGDSTGIWWARRQLDRSEMTIGPRLESSVRLGLITTAAGIVAEARDPRGLTLVIANAGVEPSLDTPLMRSLATFDTPRAWRRVVDIVERRHAELAGTSDPDFYWRQALWVATPTAFADAGTARRMKDYARLGLRSSNRESRAAAVNAIHRGRVSGFGSNLVAVLSDSTGVSRSAYMALVDLYGRGDAPSVSSPISDNAIAWWTRVLATKPAVVSRSRGEQAMREWGRRQSAARRLPRH